MRKRLIALGPAHAMRITREFQCPPGQHIVDVDVWGLPICGR